MGLESIFRFGRRKDMGKAPICKLCHERPATVPDRNSGSLKFRREVCTECHAERLRGDLIYIMEVEQKRAEKNGVK